MKASNIAKKFIFWCANKLSINMAHHKVVNIKHKFSIGNTRAYFLEMDCHVQPMKIVVVTSKIELGQVFDPHFSNSEVIARLTPNMRGWSIALDIVANSYLVIK